MPELEEAATPEPLDGAIPTQEPGPAQDEGADLSTDDASPGPPAEDSVEYWKNRYNEARRGGEDAARRARELEIRNEERMRFQQPPQYQPQPWQMPQAQPPQQPQFDADGYTAEERAQLEDASDKLEMKTVIRLQNQAAKRLQQQALWGGVLLSSQLQNTSREQQRLEQALVEKIRPLGEAAWPAVIQEARRIQNDPSESLFLKDTSPASFKSVDGGAPVNMWALERAANRLSSQSSAAPKPSGASIGAPQASRGAPGTPAAGNAFNAKGHLTELERNQNAMIRSKDPTWTDERYFKTLPKRMQELRKKGEMLTLREFKQRYGE